MADGIGFSAGVSSNQVVAGNVITYKINITNTTGFSIANTYVTNVFSSSANNVTASNNLPSSIFTGQNPISISGNKVLFRLDNLTNNGPAILTINLSPTTAGAFTNTVTAFAITALGTNTSTIPTNLITQVYSGQSELSVTITNLATGVLMNDPATIGLIVSNRGPTSAANVILSNALPVSFKLLSSTPSNLTGAFTNGALNFNLGTIASGSSTQLVVHVQPTNAGIFFLTASVFSASNLDSNVVNNAATNTMNISSNLVASLVVTNISQQYFNTQTALMNQSLRVLNVGTNDAPAFRLLVSGLGISNRLSVAVGTNNALPFALYNASLPRDQGVDLLMEYFSPMRTNIPGLEFAAVAVDRTDLAAPTNLANSVTDSSLVLKGRRLVSGAFMIEFPSGTNQTYTIIYSDNPGFSNAMVSQPPVVSSANRKQWIDSGPPRTLSHPTNTAARYYRVLGAQ